LRSKLFRLLDWILCYTLFHGFDTLGSHIREEGSLGYDSGLVCLRVQTNFDTTFNRQHTSIEGRGLHPESPTRQRAWCLAMMPPVGRPTPEGAAIMPTDKRVSEGFHPIPHHACRTHVTKGGGCSPSPPQHLHWKSPDAAESTTSTPTTRTNQPLDTATMTTPH
jgi:hypothetical protein